MNSLWNDSFHQSLHNVTPQSNKNSYLYDNTKFLPDLKNGFRVYNSDKQITAFPSFFYTENELRLNKNPTSGKDTLNQQSFFQSTAKSYGNICHLRIASSTNVLVNGDGLPYKNDHQDPGIIPTTNRYSQPAPYGKIKGVTAESDYPEQSKRRKDMKIYDYARDIFTDGNGNVYPGFQNPESLLKLYKSRQKQNIDINGDDPNYDDFVTALGQIALDDDDDDASEVGSQVSVKRINQRFFDKLSDVLVTERELFTEDVKEMAREVFKETKKVIDLRFGELKTIIGNLKINTPVVDLNGLNLTFSKQTDQLMSNFLDTLSNKLTQSSSINVPLSNTVQARSSVDEKTIQSLERVTSTLESTSEKFMGALVNANSNSKVIQTVIESVRTQMDSFDTMLTYQTRLLESISANTSDKIKNLSESKTSLTNDYIETLHASVKTLVGSELPMLIDTIRNTLTNVTFINQPSIDSNKILADVIDLQKRLSEQSNAISTLQSNSEKFNSLIQISESHSQALQNIQQFYESIKDKIQLQTKDEETFRQAIEKAIVSNQEFSKEQGIEFDLKISELESLFKNLKSDLMYFKGLYGENVSSLLLQNIKILTLKESKKSGIIEAADIVPVEKLNEMFQTFFDESRITQDDTIAAISFGNVYRTSLIGTLDDVNSHIELINQFPTNNILESAIRTSTEDFMRKYGLMDGYNVLLREAEKSIVTVKDITDYLNIISQPVRTQIQLTENQIQLYLNRQPSTQSSIQSKTSPFKSPEKKNVEISMDISPEKSEVKESMDVSPEKTDTASVVQRTDTATVIENISRGSLYNPVTDNLTLTTFDVQDLGKMQITPYQSPEKVTKSSSELTQLSSVAMRAASTQLTDNLIKAWKMKQDSEYKTFQKNVQPSDYVEMAVQLTALYGPKVSKMFFQTDSTFKHYQLTRTDNDFRTNDNTLSKAMIDDFYATRGECTSFNEISHSEEFCLHFFQCNRLYHYLQHYKEQESKQDIDIYEHALEQFACLMGTCPREVYDLLEEYQVPEFDRTPEQFELFYEQLVQQQFIPRKMSKPYFQICADEAEYIAGDFINDLLQFEQTNPDTCKYFLVNTANQMVKHYGYEIKPANSVKEFLSVNLHNQLSALRFFLYRFVQDYDNMFLDKQVLYKNLKIYEEFAGSPGLSKMFFRGFIDEGYTGVVVKYNVDNLSVYNKYLLQFEQDVTNIPQPLRAPSLAAQSQPLSIDGPMDVSMFGEEYEEMEVKQEVQPTKKTTPIKKLGQKAKQMIGKAKQGKPKKQNVIPGMETTTPSKVKQPTSKLMKNSNPNIADSVYSINNFMEKIKKYNLLSPDIDISYYPENHVKGLNYNMNSLKKDIMLIWTNYVSMKGKRANADEFMQLVDLNPLFERRNIPYNSEVARNFVSLVDDLYVAGNQKVF